MGLKNRLNIKRNKFKNFLHVAVLDIVNENIFKNGFKYENDDKTIVLNYESNKKEFKQIQLFLKTFTSVKVNGRVYDIKNFEFYISLKDNRVSSKYKFLRNDKLILSEYDIDAYESINVEGTLSQVLPRDHDLLNGFLEYFEISGIKFYGKFNVIEHILYKDKIMFEDDFISLIQDEVAYDFNKRILGLIIQKLNVKYEDIGLNPEYYNIYSDNNLNIDKYVNLNKNCFEDEPNGLINKSFNINMSYTKDKSMESLKEIYMNYEPDEIPFEEFLIILSRSIIYGQHDYLFCLHGKSGSGKGTLQLHLAKLCGNESDMLVTESDFLKDDPSTLPSKCLGDNGRLGQRVLVFDECSSIGYKLEDLLKQFISTSAFSRRGAYRKNPVSCNVLSPLVFTTFAYKTRFSGGSGLNRRVINVHTKGLLEGYEVIRDVDSGVLNSYTSGEILSMMWSIKDLPTPVLDNLINLNHMSNDMSDLEEILDYADDYLFIVGENTKINGKRYKSIGLPRVLLNHIIIQTNLKCEDTYVKNDFFNADIANTKSLYIKDKKTCGLFYKYNHQSEGLSLHDLYMFDEDVYSDLNNKKIGFILLESGEVLKVDYKGGLEGIGLTMKGYDLLKNIIKKRKSNKSFNVSDFEVIPLKFIYDIDDSHYVQDGEIVERKEIRPKEQQGLTQTFE